MDERTCAPAEGITQAKLLLQVACAPPGHTEVLAAVIAP